MLRIDDGYFCYYFYIFNRKFVGKTTNTLNTIEKTVNKIDEILFFSVWLIVSLV